MVFLSKKEDEISGYINWAKKTIEDPTKRQRVINSKWNYIGKIKQYQQPLTPFYCHKNR